MCFIAWLRMLYPQTLICFQFLHFPFDVNTKNEAERCTDYCPKASCIQTIDAIWVWFWNVVRSIYFLPGVWDSVRQNIGFPLHTGQAGVTRNWILEKLGSYLSQHSPGLTTLSWPNIVSHEKRIDPKRMIVGKRSGRTNMAWSKWPKIYFLWRKRKGTEKPKWKSHKNESQFSLMANQSKISVKILAC